MIRDRLKTASRPKYVLVLCFKYIFGLINKRQLKRALTPKDRTIAESLLADGYFLKNCKLYAYKILKDNKAHYKNYELTKDDAICIRSCISQLKDVDISWPAIPLKEVDDYINQLLSSKLDIYMGKFITKKLSFLVKSYGLTYHDIKMDMIFSGINAIYKSYPRFESKLHAINIAKRAIHNAGMGLISYNTKSCRNQLYKDNDGLFQSKVVDISSIKALPTDDSSDQLMSHKSFELLTTSDKLLNKKGKRFINIALGKYDAEFSDFIKMDNREYIEHCKYSAYLNKVRNYFGLSQEETVEFLNDVKDLL